MGEGKLQQKTLPVDCGEVTLVEKETSAALCSKSHFCEARSPKGEEVTIILVKDLKFFEKGR